MSITMKKLVAGTATLALMAPFAVGAAFAQDSSTPSSDPTTAPAPTPSPSPTPTPTDTSAPAPSGGSGS